MQISEIFKHWIEIKLDLITIIHVQTYASSFPLLSTIFLQDFSMALHDTENSVQYNTVQYRVCGFLAHFSTLYWIKK